jgi:hypothetical protein
VMWNGQRLPAPLPAPFKVVIKVALARERERDFSCQIIRRAMRGVYQVSIPAVVERPRFCFGSNEGSLG